MGEPLNVGIIGCGAIVAQYLKTLPSLPSVNLRAVADLDFSRAEAVAASQEGVRALTVDELLADPEIDTVLNLTIPAAHADVATRAIAAGKHVYGEKPLAANTSQARKVLALADEAGVRVGCAPDTVLGTGIQTARHAIDSGMIGRPISATATMVTPGHERWHPNPDFYYVPGGGPLLDMGPYYVTALVTLLGPVTSVIGAASHTRKERTIGGGPRAGETIPVSIDTHVTGVLVHESGALSTLVMSFDAVQTRSFNIEIHGEQASLTVPDPNYFDGEVSICTLANRENDREVGWEVIPTSAGYIGAGRGYGLADMALTPAGDQHRASGQLAYHVLDVMESLLRSAADGSSVPVLSTAERPAAVALTSLSEPVSSLAT
ncbi:Gfo/Idh/MocA family protein [Arthrobacter sp. MDB2-24]